MEWSEFKRNISRAELQIAITKKPSAKEFWEGYQQGLRRRYHGEKFRTAKEHRLLMKSNEIRAIGYQSGYSGMPFTEADLKLVYLRLQ